MKNTQRVLCAALAACVTFFSVISPETAQAKRNEQVDGLIFWGTSGMDLLHGDLKTEEARTSMSTGSAESDMHAWFDGSSASDYDAAKQNYFDSSFFGGQYQISGAGSTRSSGSKKGMSLSGFEYNNGSKGAHHDSVMQMIENQISGGWEGKKTFVALWAGEDWICVMKALKSKAAAART